MKIALIMLAAGNSRRFGSNKLIYEMNGKPMYQHILEQLFYVKKDLQEDYDCCITVVTQYRIIAEAAERKGAQVLINQHPEEGISSSLKIGLRANMDAEVCLFTVSDQPWLKADTIRLLIQGFFVSGKNMGCLALNRKMGNPCMFRKKYYPELLLLEGDTGGKRVLRAHSDDVYCFNVMNEKELEDFDYFPEIY